MRKGRSDMAKHPGLHKRTARGRVEAHLARMLAFDFEPGVKKWRRACGAQGWYWTREQQADFSGELPGAFSRPSEISPGDRGGVGRSIQRRLPYRRDGR